MDEELDKEKQNNKQQYQKLKNCKIDGIKRFYDLDNLDSELEKRFEYGDSYTDMARYVNKNILSQAIEKIDLDVMEKEIETKIEMLQNGRQSEKEKIKREIKNGGIDPEFIEKDLVQYYHIKKHLNDCLELDVSKRENNRDSPKEKLEDVRNIVEKTKKQLKSILKKEKERIKTEKGIDVEETSIILEPRLLDKEGKETSIFSILKNLEKKKGFDEVYQEDIDRYRRFRDEIEIDEKDIESIQGRGYIDELEEDISGPHDIQKAVEEINQYRDRTIDVDDVEGEDVGISTGAKNSGIADISSVKDDVLFVSGDEEVEEVFEEDNVGDLEIEDISFEYEKTELEDKDLCIVFREDKKDVVIGKSDYEKYTKQIK